MGALADVNVLVAPMHADCYLAAFAIAGGHRLVSFDRGLRRFRGLSVVFPA